MDNHQDDNKDIKNEDDINTKKQHRYLRLDDDVRKKSFIAKTSAFSKKWIYFLVFVLLFIAIIAIIAKLLIGMTSTSLTSSKLNDEGEKNIFLDCS